MIEGDLAVRPGFLLLVGYVADRPAVEPLSAERLAERFPHVRKEQRLPKRKRAAWRAEIEQRRTERGT